MKKLICLILGLLLLSLTACGKPAASSEPPDESAGTGVVSSEAPDASAPDQSDTDPSDEQDTPAKPDEQDEPDASGTPDDEPEIPAYSVFQDAVPVTFMGLADSHTAEVQLEDGSYLALQFDSAQYGDVLGSMGEGDCFMALLESEPLNGGGSSWKLADYYGMSYQGVLLLDAQVSDHYDWELVNSDVANQTFALYITEELRDISLYPLTFQDDGSLKKGELWTGKENLNAGAMVKLNLFVEEYYPNWLLEYTLSDGTQVRYSIGMAEEPLYLAVCLAPIGGRLVE